MDRHESAARAVTTAVLLSGQLDGLMSAWERTIATGHASTAGLAHGGLRTEPSAAIAELERELGALQREETDLRALADTETRRAVAWDGRAMRAGREGRDDLVRLAVRRREEHHDASKALGAEAAATAEVADAVRTAIATASALTPRSSQGT